MTIESGRFRVMVSFNSYPMMVHFIYKDQVLKVNASDLIFLRSVVKKAIIKVKQLAPSKEDKDEGNVVS